MLIYYILVVGMPLIEHPLFAATLGSATVIKYLGALCLLYAICEAIARRVVPSLLSTWQARAFICFYSIAALSWLTQPGKGKNDSPLFDIYTSQVLFMVTTLLLVNSLKRVRWTLLLAVGSIGLTSLYLIREWQKGSAVYAGYRPGYIAGDANSFAASAVVCLPVALAFATSRHRGWKRIFAFACIGVTLIAIILAASRGGFIALLAAVAAQMLRSTKQRRSGVLIIAGLSLLLVIVPQSPLQRLLHPTQSDELSVTARTTMWRLSARMILAHPFSGIGIGQFGSVMAPLGLHHVAHNTYIETAVELGVPGIATFGAMLLFSIRSLERTRNIALSVHAPFLARTTEAVQAGIIGFSVSLLFLSGQHLKLFWLMIFVSMSLATIARRQQRHTKGVRHTRMVVPPITARESLGL